VDILADLLGGVLRENRTSQQNTMFHDLIVRLPEAPLIGCRLVQHSGLLSLRLDTSLALSAGYITLARSFTCPKPMQCPVSWTTTLQTST